MSYSFNPQQHFEQTERLILSLESRNIAQEGIGDIIKSIGQRVSAEFKDSIDRIEYFYTIFQLEKEKSLKARQALSRMDSKEERNVFLPATKFTMYGDKKVVSFIEEYSKQAQIAVNALSAVNNNLTVFLEDDFMKSWKNLVSPIIGYDKVYMEYFNNLRSLLTTLEKATHCQKSVTEQKTEYISMSYLGLSHFEFKLPNEKTYDINDPDSCRKVHQHFWASLWREEKFETKLFKDRVAFYSVNKKQIEQLLNELDSLIDSYDGLLGLKQKLSHTFSSFIASDNMQAPALGAALLSNYRIMSRTAWLLNYLTGNCFAYSRGLSNHMLHVATEFVDAKPNRAAKESYSMGQGYLLWR
jgi:hypothetical protein